MFPITQSLFGKSLPEVTVEDLKVFFSEAQTESSILEFKSYSLKDTRDQTSKENDIIKCLCGFLNTEGGLLIWGAPEGKQRQNADGSKEKIFEGELSPVNLDITKDKFIGRIASSITPSPSNILFQQIQFSESSYVYVIEVTKSEYPPHQFQHIYYMRLDGQTKPAPHAYVEALMKQVKYPNLAAFLYTDFESFATKSHGVIPIVVFIANLSRFIAAFNLHLSVIVDHGTFVFEEENIKEIEERGRGVLDQFEAKILLYNKPVMKKLFLVLPEIWNADIVFNIVLSFYSDNSPVKNSLFTFQHFATSHSPTPQIRLLNKEENKFSFENDPSKNKTDEQRLLETAMFYLNKSKRNMWNHETIKGLG